mmetsp:Transcript_80670/g.155808  ORF Transcript_80670/g.155808 Transcript_80670/m.155808 type:complete len:211 (+) Transcript_80670:451-1083(+)
MILRIFFTSSRTSFVRLSIRSTAPLTSSWVYGTSALASSTSLARANVFMAWSSFIPGTLSRMLSALIGSVLSSISFSSPNSRKKAAQMSAKRTRRPRRTARWLRMISAVWAQRVRASVEPLFAISYASMRIARSMLRSRTEITSTKTQSQSAADRMPTFFISSHSQLPNVSKKHEIKARSHVAKSSTCCPKRRMLFTAMQQYTDKKTMKK